MKYTELSELIQNEIYDTVQSRDNLKNFQGSAYTFKEMVLQDMSIREEIFQEAIDSGDYDKLRDIIRAEIAALMLDLFKKRNVWI